MGPATGLESPPPPAEQASRTPSMPWVSSAVLIVLGYLVSFTVLDRAAAFFDVLPAISPWYPPAGLNLALLLSCGPHYGPAIFVGHLISGLWIHQLPVASTVAVSSIIALCNTAVVVMLRDMVRVDPRLQHLRDARWLALTALVMPLVMALPAVAVFAVGGITPWPDYLLAVRDWWIGDAVGIVILTPVLLIHGVPMARTVLQVVLNAGAGAEGTAALQWRWPDSWVVLEIAAQGVSVILGLWVAFGSQFSNEFHLVYFCFLPLIWIALRRGLPGAAVGILAINVGAVLAVRTYGFPLSDVADLQVFMVALSLTGLFLGAVVSERHRAEDALYRAHGELERRVVERTAELLQANTHLQQEIAERLHTEGRLQAQNKELLVLYEQVERDRTTKAVLLRELNHRVRNNLAAVLSLLEIERRWAHLKTGEQVLSTCSARLQAIARAHELLAAGAFAPVDLRDFIEAVAGGVIREVGEGSPQIEVFCRDASLKLPPKQFVALACITNELLLNAVKHAFRGRAHGRIDIRTWEEGDRYLLEVRDDGIGFPKDTQKEGSGLEIVSTLCRTDLRGDCCFFMESGTVARISFPKLSADMEGKR